MKKIRKTCQICYKVEQKLKKGTRNGTIKKEGSKIAPIVEVKRTSQTMLMCNTHNLLFVKINFHIIFSRNT